MIRRRGYALVVALAVLFVLLTLALALFHSRGAMSSLIAMNQRFLGRTGLARDTSTRFGLLLEGLTAGPGDPLSLQQNFKVRQNGFQASVTWEKETGSARGQDVRDPQLGKKLLAAPSEWDALPEVGYGEDLAVEALDGVAVAPAHWAVGLDFLGGERYLTMYDRSFPYAVYAPNGAIKVGKVRAYTNPSWDEDMAAGGGASGLPIWLLARSQVFVSDCAYGRVWSGEGPIHMRGGAVGLVGPLPVDRLGPELATDSQYAMRSLSADTLDKTPALVGHLLTVQTFEDFFKDPARIVPIMMRGLSLQQATMVPFVPIPSIQKAGVVVVLFHHPWPPDFGKRDDGPELNAKLLRLSREETALGEREEKLRTDSILLQRKIFLNPNDPKVPEWRAEIRQLEASRSKVQEQRKIVYNEFHRVRRELEQGAWERGAVRGQAPRNWWHELSYNTIGWTYLGVVEQIVKSLGDLIESQDWTKFMGRLASVTRLVHLGWDDPEFFFPDGQPTVRDGDAVERPRDVPTNALSMKSTVNVPPGRTLKLTTNVQIRGDLWIQRGATMHVRGDLEVRAPIHWRDFNGESLEPTDPLFPAGRVFIEEGATLVVDGDLKCLGGRPETGSIIVTGPVGRVNAVSSAIFCGGHFTSTYGIQPGSTLLDYLQARAKDKAYLRGWVDFLWGMAYMAPQAARVVGPFTPRNPWFARFATVFVIPPKPPIPVPVPLPLSNCYATFFPLFSGAASVQLNLRLGPNFTTMAWPLWIFGRGVVPVLNKVEPQVLWPRVDSFPQKVPEIVWSMLGPAIEAFIVETIKGALIELVVEIGSRAVEAMLKNTIPFNPVACLSFSWDKEGIQPPSLVSKFLNDLAGMVTLGLISTVNAIALVVKQEMTRNLMEPPEKMAREAAGLYLYSGGMMTIGTTPSTTPLATGFFVSGYNLRCNAALTVGALVSLNGRVEANDVAYYPYFTEVNLYNPLKPRNYLGRDKPNDYFPLDEMRDLLVSPVTIPLNEEPPLMIGRAHYRPVARGWSR